MQLSAIPRTITFDGASFAPHAEAIRRDEALMDCLRAQAERRMEGELLTVTKRGARAPSGDAHDYASYGPYWWPNPDTPDGLPYIRRDGQRNPIVNEKHSMDGVFRAVGVLALAACYFGDARYAARAADYLRAWFLDPETAMHPHLRYAQAIPGVCDGRGIGIIETRGVYEMVDAMALLEAMGWLPPEIRAGVAAWYTQYLDWQLTSENGADEDSQHNNHGTWYDVQTVSAALFLGRTHLARRTLTLAFDRRLAKHIDGEGRQPHELARTNALGYSAMNLDGLMLLGQLSRRVADVKADYWHAIRPGMALPPLQAALEYILPYATTLEGFPYQQISGKPATEAIAHLLLRADPEYPEAGYAKKAAPLLTPEMLWRLWPTK